MMSVIDQKGKLFGKISVVDIIIVLAFAIAAAGFVYKISSGDATVAIKSDTPFTVVLRIDNARQFTVDAIEVGEQVYEEHADLMGTVTDVRAETHYDYGDNWDGTQTYAPMEGRYNIFITLSCKGRIAQDGTYYLGGSRQVAKNAAFKVESPTFKSSAKVAEISQ